MNQFKVFFKKEIMEAVRTKKILIIAIVFGIFAILSPVTAKYMNDILRWSLGSALPEGFGVVDTTWIDGWMEFYNELNQIGIFCIIFMYMGSVAGEKKSGTAALTLTKNLSHAKFIITKYIVQSLTFIVTFVVSFFICYGYVFYLFGEAGNFGDLIGGGLMFLVYVLLVLAIVILASTIAKSSAISAVMAFAGYILLGLTSMIPEIGKYMPGELAGKIGGVTAGQSALTDYLGAVGVSVLLIVLFIGLAVRILKKQEL